MSNVTPGQAESGKSTILKNFQLHFAPKAFQAEVPDLYYSPRFIIYLDVLGRSMAARNPPQSRALRQLRAGPPGDPTSKHIQQPRAALVARQRDERTAAAIVDKFSPVTAGGGKPLKPHRGFPASR